ncbi:unnamed protein product [Notodromas monacha]|uniref:Uncharacterized protein n=1 Tax=Notodromas monacha TaxID=399045 RepID=A0A7R9G9T1_9CRUS|nr:unnamed protein product [Notodromas monacha]CAG0914573.1 unnamed protein product [Notodromas monacha]
MMARQAVAHNGDEILPYNPVPHQSSNPSAVAVKPRLDLKPYAQQCKTKSRKLGNARVWMESSFVGTQPILSPETPSGDLAMFVFDDPSLLNGDADPSNLVPMVKLRSGSAQLDAYVVQRELDARKNGHLQSKKASSMSEQNLLLTQKHWSAQGKGLGTISKSRHHHCSDQGFQHHHPSSSSEPEPLSMQPEKENAVAIAAAMLTEGLNKRMMFAVDPDDFKPITSSSSSKPGETPEPTRRGSTSLDDVLSSLLALPPSPASANNNKNAVEDNDHHHHHFGSSSVLGRSGSLRRPTSQPDLDQQRRSKSPVIHEGGGAAGAYSWRKQENGTLAATAGTEGTNKVKMRHESLGDQTTRSKSPSLLDAERERKSDEVDVLDPLRSRTWISSGEASRRLFTKVVVLLVLTVGGSRKMGLWQQQQEQRGRIR